MFQFTEKYLFTNQRLMNLHMQIYKTRYNPNWCYIRADTQY